MVEGSRLHMRAGMAPDMCMAITVMCGLLCSVWTIDLAHLLCKFKINVRFTTQMLGPNPAYADERFYMEHMQQDAVRVRQLFKVRSPSLLFAPVSRLVSYYVILPFNLSRPDKGLLVNSGNGCK